MAKTPFRAMRGAPPKSNSEKFTSKIPVYMSKADRYLIAATAKIAGTNQQAFVRQAVLSYIRGSKFRIVFDPISRGLLYKTLILIGFTAEDKDVVAAEAKQVKCNHSKFIREIARGKCLYLLGAEQYNEILHRYIKNEGERDGIEFVSDLSDPSSPGSVRIKPRANPLERSCSVCGAVFVIKSHHHEPNHEDWCRKCRVEKINEITERMKEVYASDAKVLEKINKVSSCAIAYHPGATMSEIAAQMGTTKQSVSACIAWFWAHV